jgi:hypothetical protein
MLWDIVILVAVVAVGYWAYKKYVDTTPTDTQ